MIHEYLGLVLPKKLNHFMSDVFNPVCLNLKNVSSILYSNTAKISSASLL